MWNLFSKLPAFIRNPLIRRLFYIDYDLPKNLIFKRAETYHEIEEAFKVAYEAYYERGLESDTEYRLRLTKHHALPTTCILIGKIDEEVVATMTIIVDSALGLPIEKLWNIDEIRNSSGRIAEISTLAIKRGFRAQRGKLLLPLCGFMYRYCTRYLGVDKIVATYHPEVQDFYKSVLLFKPIGRGEIKTYEFVKGAAAVGGFLDIKNVPLNYSKVYGKKSLKQNLYHFFEIKVIENYQFDHPDDFNFAKFHFTPSLLEYFFRNRSEAFEQMTPEERIVVATAYFYPEYQKVVLQKELAPEDTGRRQIRFAVNFEVQWAAINEEPNQHGKLLEISPTGLKLSSVKTPHLKRGEKIQLWMFLRSGIKIPLAGEVKWVNHLQMGVSLNEFLPSQWLEIVQILQQHVLTRLADSEAGMRIKKTS